MVSKVVAEDTLPEFAVKKAFSALGEGFIGKARGRDREYANWKKSPPKRKLQTIPLPSN